MSYTPLTKEQYDSARRAGFTPDQIIANEQVRKSKEAEPSGIIEGAKGFLKGAGRSAVNILKAAQTGPGLFTNMPAKEPITAALNVAEEKLQPTNMAQKIGGYIETGAEILAPLPGGKRQVAESLIGRARSLYESALKLPTTLAPAERAKMISTGLREGITISESGIDKAASTIDNLETQLGDAIKNAAGAGKTVKTKFLKPFIDDAKRAFGDLTDVDYSTLAISKIDNLWNSFTQRYGENIPVALAQTIKKNTYQMLKKAYGELASPVIEGNKQLARGLKEGVLEVAPLVKGVNERLGDLYNFEKGLERATNRAGNLDVVSLGSKLFLGGKDKASGVLAIVNEIFKPAGKSFTAVQLNRLGQFLSTKGDNEIKAFKTLTKTLGPVNVINLMKGVGDVFRND